MAVKNGEIERVYVLFFFTPCKYCVIFALPSVVCECGSVAEWLGCWTCDQRVAGSNSGFPAIECSPVGCLFYLV